MSGCGPRWGEPRLFPLGLACRRVVLVTLPQPGRFTGTQLRALQRRVKDWRDIMAKRLVYAASDEHAVEQRFREGSVWS